MAFPLPALPWPRSRPDGARPLWPLLGAEAAAHDARAAAKGVPTWAALGEEARRGRARLLLPVHRDTFHRLGPLALAAAALAGAPAPPALPEPFRPRPLHRVDRLLPAWLEHLRFALAGLPVEVGEPDDDLRELLAAVARSAHPENEGTLLRLLGALTGAVFRGPHTFHLDVANACNVDCVYCWFHSPLAKGRPDAGAFDRAWKREVVEWDVFTRLVDDLAGMGTCEDVLFSGKGEPLLHPRILDMIPYVKGKGMGLSLFTNGLLLREDARRALVDHGVDLLYVSLSSASPAVYEALHPGHPGRELDEVRRNVSELTRSKREADAESPRVMMVDVVTTRNCAELLDFYEMSRDLGAEFVRYQLVHVQPYNRELMLLPDQVGRLREDLAEAHRREAAGGPRIVDNIDWQVETLDPATGRWGHARLPGEGCYVGWTFSRSWTNGDVSFCCSPKVVDNLNERGFAEIWNGETYSAFRNAARDLARHGDLTFRNGARLLGDHCAGCPNYEGIGRLAADLRRYGLDRFVRGADAERVSGRA
ncbi:radical SAM protein [Myxococcota bacterium]|nr:radical SAM protein [Myxococcota bacterium]